MKLKHQILIAITAVRAVLGEQGKLCNYEFKEKVSPIDDNKMGFKK